EIGAHREVLVEESPWIFAIRPDAADARGQVNNNDFALRRSVAHLFVHTPDRAHVGEIEARGAGNDDPIARNACCLQPSNHGRSRKRAASGGDVGLVAEVRMVWGGPSRTGPCVYRPRPRASPVPPRCARPEDASAAGESSASAGAPRCDRAEYRPYVTFEPF